jgi:vacuolar-type H+-ATPase subunit I/STV1
MEMHSNRLALLTAEILQDEYGEQILKETEDLLLRNNDRSIEMVGVVLNVASILVGVAGLISGWMLQNRKNRSKKDMREFALNRLEYLPSQHKVVVIRVVEIAIDVAIEQEGDDGEV